MDKLTRREFLKCGGLGAAALMVVPSSVLGKKFGHVAPSDKLNIAGIGVGGVGRRNLGFMKTENIVALCDADWGYAARTFGDFPKAKLFKDWRVMFDQMKDSIDAVLVATPDHTHATIAAHAMTLGKHVYCQKPLTLGINEGRELVRVAKMTGVTFQVGNQGRSASVKRVAAEIVRNGYLGECRTACVRIPGGPDCKYVGQRAKSTARGKVPGFFTPEGWKMYLGPSQHWEDDAYIPAIHDAQVWRCNCRTGNGITPDFGAHDVDTVQWAFGVDRSGPVAIENARFSDWFEPREILSWANTFSFDLVYADGRRCHVKSYDPKHGEPRSVTFNGSVGTLVEGLYSGLPVKLQLPPALKKWREKTDLKGSDIRFHAPKDGHPHEQDFIDGIYGGATSTDCEIGHRTTSACLLATICQRLGVSRLEWDPVNEVFTGAHAAEANKLLDVPYLNGWSL